MTHKNFSRKAIILSCILLGIAVCVMLVWSTVNAMGEETSDIIISRDAILFTKMLVSSDKVIIAGSFADSAMGYKGYEYELVGNTLNLWVYQADLFAKDPVGGMSIEIQDDFSSLESIYLMQGEKMPPTLIWTSHNYEFIKSDEWKSLPVDISMQSPIVFSKNSITVGGDKTLLVNIEMINGRYFFEEFPSPLPGSNWNGECQIRVYTDESDL